MATRKIARDASTGQFTTRRAVRRSPATTVMETVPVSRNPVRRPKRRAVRHLAAANQHAGTKPGRDR